MISSTPCLDISQTYEGLLTGNKIWQKRTMDVGVISAEDAIDLGVTGPACAPRA